MPQNILFITTDQQRRDTLGCYGNDLIRTPCLDRMAAQGATLERAYCESPICMPSRVTMITGRIAAHHGTTLHCSRMRPDEPTIGEVLQGAGYRTHFVGKPHFNTQEHPGNPESIPDWRDGTYDGFTGPYAGFEHFECILGHSNALVGHYGEWLRREHAEQLPKFWLHHMRPLEGDWPHEGMTCANDVPQELHSSAWVADRSIAAIDAAREEGKPFYVFASFPDPHWPITPPEPWFSMYDDVEMPPDHPAGDLFERDDMPRNYRAMGTNGEKAYEGGGRRAPDPERVARIKRAYWGAVSWIDANVGRMLDHLDAQGLSEDTLVVFTTDHGEYMGDHGMIAKGGFLWESFIHVPCLVRCPGTVPAGARPAGLLSFEDLVPTMLDLVGVGHALPSDGVSQAPVWRGDATAVRDTVHVTHYTSRPEEGWPDQHCLVTAEDEKLVYHAGDEHGELFDLSADPGEQVNLWHDPAHQERRDELVLKLLDEIVLRADLLPVRQKNEKKMPMAGRHLMTKEVWGPEMERYGF